MRQSKRVQASAALAATIVLAAQPAAFAQEGAPESNPSIVVTTEVLGAVVSEVAGDDAAVTVLMPAGADPHTWQPSARDAERMLGAALLVENGLGLEEGLLSVIDQARDEGVSVFTATDHIEVLFTDEDEDHDEHADDHAEDEDHDHAEGEEHADDHAEDEDHDHAHSHGPEDPHFWLDPVAMGAVVEALAPALEATGIDAADRADAVIADLSALDAEISAILSGIEEDQRKLVTGHEALGYFADRYGFEVVGTVIPDDTTSGDASARDVANLIETVRAEGVSVVFTDVGTPQSVARAIADEGGAEIVELSVAQLPDDGSYQTFMLQLAQAIADAFAA